MPGSGELPKLSAWYAIRSWYGGGSSLSSLGGGSSWSISSPCRAIAACRVGPDSSSSPCTLANASRAGLLSSRTFAR